MDSRQERSNNETTSRDGGASGARQSGDASGAFEYWKAIVPMIADLIPLFFDKWAELNHRSTFQDLERDQQRLARRLGRLAGRMRWYQTAFFLLLLWNIVLTVFLIIK